MKLPTPKEALILQQLRRGERYGLEMVKASDGALKRGTIYVTLLRMEDAGLVTSREDSPGRRLYRATDRGRRMLAARNAALAVLGDLAG